MIKVAYNRCYGGFSLSPQASKLVNALKGGEEVVDPKFGFVYIPRHDPDLIEAIETLGTEEASSTYASISIEIVKGDRYRIQEYDGLEWVETPDTIDWIVVESDE